MSIIKVAVDDQALYVTESPVVAAQGVNENYFQFTLSADWTGFGVVALFWKEGNETDVYESVVDGTGKALVPHEVTDSQGRICVGLAGTKGNIIHTSEVLKYKVVRGRYTAGQSSEPPTPGIYEQMLSLAGQMSDQFQQVVQEQAEIIEDLQADQAALRSELITQQTTFENTVSGQMASFIASQSGDYGATVLWDMDTEGDHNGALGQDTVLTLRENIENFDYLEIWGFNTDVDDSVFIPVEKLSGVGTAVKSVNIGMGTTKLRIVETRLMGQFNELTIAHQFIFTFDTAHTATRITQDNKSTYVSQFGISRVIGRKMVQNAELVDIRVGENGTTYQTAGAAVRGQFTEVKAQIPLIDASLATAGKAADAKATGDALTAVNGRLAQHTGEIDNLKAIGDMGEYNIYVTDWTVGRRSTGALNDYYYSSGIIKTPCEIYFDATNYKLSFVRCNADGSEHGSAATWRTESPVSIPVNATYGYCWLEIQHAVTQTSITDSELADIKANTYYITPIPIVETIKQALTSAYVDGVNGLDTNDGTSAYPYKTISKAVDSGRNTIFVANGTYNEFVFIQNREKLTILPWAYGLSFDPNVPDTPKIEITGGTCAIRAYDCGELTFVGIYGHDTTRSAFDLLRNKIVKMVNCWASDVTDAEWNGFKISSCNGVFQNCRAWNIGRDGFGISIYGNTQFIDCVAHDCGDDGVSHHDGCTGAVIGGEYYNCEKGGVASPTYGSYIDVINVYSHDNRYGLYSVTDSTRRRSKARVSGCVFKNNTGKDIYINNNDIVGWNNIYDSKSLINQATFTEF